MHKLEHGELEDEEDLFEASTAVEFTLDDLDYEFFRQPPGVYEAIKIKDGVFEAKNRPGLIIEDQMDHVQRAAGKYWIANPDAENLCNLPIARKGELPITRWGYYLHRVSKKELSWIQCYYEGKNVFVQEGKPVIPEFNPEFHVVDELPILDDVPLEGGIDVGGGTLCPAIVFGQRHPINGAYLIHHEYSPSDIGVDRFGDNVIRMISRRYPENIELHKFGCDPAAKQRDQIFKIVVMNVLRDKGLPVYSANTNEIDVRIAAIKHAMGKWNFDRPMVLISRRGCPKLIKGLAGGWHYKRKDTTASNPQYREVPEKDAYSHPCDALGYWFLLAGEVVKMTHANRSREGLKTVIAQTDFDPLNP